MQRQAHHGVDTSFDRFARMVRNAIGTPVALVSIVERDRQVFPGAIGLPEPWQSQRATPLSMSFCQYVVEDRSPLIIADARTDERLHDNEAIDTLGVMAYAGWPIHDHTGAIIGSLCAIDHQPREWTTRELQLLGDMASACSTELSERALRLEAAEQAWSAHALSDRSRVLLALSEGLSATSTIEEVAASVERIALDNLGCLRAGIWLRDDPLETRRSADLPLVEASTGALTFVSGSSHEWRSASRLNAHLRLDESNPLGAAILRDSSLFFASRDEQDRCYPHLVNPEQIGEARAFLPLSIKGRVFGTLTLLWPDQRDMSDEDRITITALTSYTAQAVQRALLYQDRIDALVTLQSSLLPRLPEVEELDLAARYRPAATRDQVGGDWYDAVRMRSGEISLMIGDVVGHDMDAAAVMGQLRTMLRTIAWGGGDSPARNVTRLDQAIADLGVEGMATLVKARIEREGEDWVLSWTNAGHPPPLLLDPAGAAALVDEGTPDLMLGVLADSERTDHRTIIRPGSLLLLYTDGLVERRGEDITAGLERLRRCAESHAGLPAAKFLDAVLGELVGGRPDDDVAVLAVRFNPEDH